MKEEYEIIFVPNEGRAIKSNKTNKIYYSEFQIIEEKNQEIEQLKSQLQQKENIIKELDKAIIEFKKQIEEERKNYREIIGNFVDKLQELKGSDK